MTATAWMRQPVEPCTACGDQYAPDELEHGVCAECRLAPTMEALAAADAGAVGGR